MPYKAKLDALNAHQDTFVTPHMRMAYSPVHSALTPQAAKVNAQIARQAIHATAQKPCLALSTKHPKQAMASANTFLPTRKVHLLPYKL